MIKNLEIKNYKIYIDGKLLKELKEIYAKPEKNCDKKTHYFRKQNWQKNSRR